MGERRAGPRPIFWSKREDVRKLRPGLKSGRALGGFHLAEFLDYLVIAAD
jgi:hypothetical protein